jgi:hypothetical protein
LTSRTTDPVRAIRDEYLANSSCTDPAQRPTAEAAIRRLYKLVGQSAPQFIWCQSPAAIRLIARMLDADFPEERAIWLGEFDGLFADYRPGGPAGVPCHADLLGRAALEDSLKRSLSKAPAPTRELRRDLGLLLGGRPGIPEQLVTASRGDVLSRPVPDLLGEPLGEAVGNSLQEVRWPQTTAWGNKPRQDIRWPAPAPRARIRLWLPRSSDYLGNGWKRGGGQFHTWMAEFDASRRLGLVSYDELDSEQLELWRTLTGSCGWWEPYQHICFITERPAVIRAETPGDRGHLRLHCPDGPAITYRDGWSVYAWHGIRVPASLIEDGWDADAIMAERNAEVRRCAIEKLGWNAFEQHLIPVASAPDPGNPGQVLTLCDLPAAIRNTYPGPVRLLLCSNGTPEPDGTRRRFALQVPPHHTDPVTAAAELYGWTRHEYASLARRA